MTMSFVQTIFNTKSLKQNTGYECTLFNYIAIFILQRVY